MKLRAGMRYKRRDGKITGPLEKGSGGTDSGVAFFDDTNTSSHYSSGEWVKSMESPQDLIEEYPWIDLKEKDVAPEGTQLRFRDRSVGDSWTEERAYKENETLNHGQLIEFEYRAPLILPEPKTESKLYSFLKKNQLIKDGDEFWCADSMSWRKSASAGKLYDDFIPYRRLAINQGADAIPEEIPKEPEYETRENLKYTEFEKMDSSWEVLVNHDWINKQELKEYTDRTPALLLFHLSFPARRPKQPEIKVGAIVRVWDDEWHGVIKEYVRHDEEKRLPHFAKNIRGVTISYKHAEPVPEEVAKWYQRAMEGK